MGKARITVLVGVAILALAGCLRQSAAYDINLNGTVDAEISIGMHEDYIDPSQPYNGITAVQEILDHFTTDTIVDNNYGEWVGYRIYLDDEPMSHFSDPPAGSWDLQILGDDSDWVVYGIEYDSAQDDMYQTITDNDGYVDISVLFRGGALIEENGAVFTMVPAPGVAQWDLATIMEQPYARGQRPPVPPDPPDPPDPDPVVTVIITPDPDPIVTPSATSSASPTVSAGPGETPEGEDDGIPVWVWITGGGLLAAVVGLGTYLLTSRSKGAASEDEATEPEEKKAKPKGD